MVNLFVLCFFVLAGNTVGHGENSLQSKYEKESSSFTHLIYLLMKDISDITNENRALKDKVDDLETQILDINNENKGLKEKVETLRTQLLVVDSKTEDINDINNEINRVLQDKFDALETQMLDINNENKGLKEKVETLETQMLVLDSKTEELRWEEWGSWGSCGASCSGGVGERLQSRTRHMRAPDDATSQTESRPCNSVQFAGCLHPNNTDQFFAVAYDYSHTLAQATCTAMAPRGYIRAVKRTCSSSAADCNAVCKSVGKTCFNALHVYSGTNAPAVNRDTAGQKSLIMYRYNGCGGQFCGPNFCCCQSMKIVWG